MTCECVVFKVFLVFCFLLMYMIQSFQGSAHILGGCIWGPLLVSLHKKKKAMFGRSQYSYNSLITDKPLICIGFPIWFVMKVKNAAADNDDNIEYNDRSRILMGIHSLPDTYFFKQAIIYSWKKNLKFYRSMPNMPI